jgi:hypothetical protein
MNGETGKSYWGGRLSTVDLLVLTSLCQLVFILKILFSFFTKQATLMRSSTVLSLPLSLVFLGWEILKDPHSFKQDVEKGNLKVSILHPWFSIFVLFLIFFVGLDRIYILRNFNLKCIDCKESSSGILI